jgi:hypothetical protein
VNAQFQLDRDATIAWLQAHYREVSGSELWQGHGIHIGTLDNPGWLMSVTLSGTPLETTPVQDCIRGFLRDAILNGSLHKHADSILIRSKHFEGVALERSDDDWIVCRIQENAFEGYGDASKLGTMLEVYRAWVSDQAVTPDESLSGKDAPQSDSPRWCERVGWYQESIRRVLLEEWNPLGLPADVEATTAYYRYIPTLYGMLAAKKSRTDLRNHLTWLQTERMGLPVTPDIADRVADRLLSVKNEMEGGPQPFIRFPTTTDCDDLTWLQYWYAQWNNEDWEHSYGVLIDTTDERGWSLKVDLTETDLEDRPFEAIEQTVSPQNWLRCKVSDASGERKTLEATGVATKLAQTLRIFRTWAT